MCKELSVTSYIFLDCTNFFIFQNIHVYFFWALWYVVTGLILKDSITQPWLQIGLSWSNLRNAESRVQPPEILV